MTPGEVADWAVAPLFSVVSDDLGMAATVGVPSLSTVQRALRTFVTRSWRLGGFIGGKARSARRARRGKARGVGPASKVFPPAALGQRAPQRRLAELTGRSRRPRSR